MGGLELPWLRGPPVNLYMACFCFYFSAGENYRFFSYALDDLAEFQSFYLLFCRPWLEP
jgi:hypothetical protein